MSNKSQTISHRDNRKRIVAIPFRKKLDDRETFNSLFHEGMSLVEATANYLDGPSRRESKCLPPYLSLTYATESMRLTTRLTQLATWLLARRAVMNGDPVPRGHNGNDPLELPPFSKVRGFRAHEQLPAKLRELSEQTIELHRKICAFDGVNPDTENRAKTRSGTNPVAAQIAQINTAFG